jgi:hypothetical protein
MPQEPTASRSRNYSPIRRTIAIAAIPVFATACGIFVWLAVKWNAQLAIDSQYSVHTDGLSLSVTLARIAACVLFVGLVLAILELCVGPRVMADRPSG